MAQSIHSAVTTYKQKRFDTAALEAMKAYDARAQIVPVEAKLNGTDKAIIAKQPRLFNFSLWNGLPNAWIEECFGDDLGKRLVKIKLIRVEPHPVTLPAYLDVQIAEAAGFHRAINIWNKSRSWPPMYVQEQLRDQATELGKILSVYNIDEPNTLPGKFKDSGAVDCPYRIRLPDRQAANSLLASSYFDVYLGMRDY